MFEKETLSEKKEKGEKLQKRKIRGENSEKERKEIKTHFLAAEENRKKTRRIIEDNNEEEKDPFACCGCSRFGIGAEVHPRSSKHARHVESDPSKRTKSIPFRPARE